MDTQAFFTEHRNKLVELVGEGIFVFTAHTKIQQKADSEYRFSQDATFWYLSGINQPDWLLIIDGYSGRSYLVQPDIDVVHELFTGALSAEQALKQSGVNEILNPKQATQLLKKLAEKYTTVYGLGPDPYAKYYDFSLNPAPQKLWRRLQGIFGEVESCRKSLARLRARKSPEEVKLIKKSIDLTAAAFQEMKVRMPHVSYEYEIEAEFTYYFRRHNAIHAYDPIVASGANACTLHYTANDATISDSNLVLIDIGASVDGYNADVTRTYAIDNDHVSGRQRNIHDSVARAHRDIISIVKPGLGLGQYSNYVDARMKEALMELDLLSDSSDQDTYRHYFPHAVSHGLGIDVHESFGGYSEFQEGMVFTVEPGIYIPEEGIGVRIEDDILITETGYENLSETIMTDL